jgi:hypothetical protein
VLTEAGETFEGGDTTKCPGESNCDDWNSHTGDDDQATKETKVCLGCPMFSSKTSSENEASEIHPQEVEEIVDDIADMIFLANGGHETDWNEYGIEIYRLFCEWRRAEKDVAERRSQFTQAFLKSMCK